MRYVDPIHGIIDLPNIIFQIIDTELFQRLRSLKQLGACSYVFSGATHTRFEHSIGVCHLVDKFLDQLAKNSNIQISDYLRKCVTIAGLLHDVGHGPFSHMWDQFVHEHSDWNHEISSCNITRHIFHKYDIKLSSDQQEHLNGIDIIVAFIVGDVECLRKYLGDDQMYLSEIVNNKFCFIDVDKWDYILRDSYYLNNVISIPKGFERIFKGAKVTVVDGVSHISYHYEDYHLIHELLENRTNLHVHCYQHPEIIGVEQILVEAFLSAELNGFLFRGVKLSEAHIHPEVYQYLDDSIIQIITISNDVRLKEAQECLKRIRTRNLYPIVGMSSQKFEMSNIQKDLKGRFIQKIRHIPTADEIMPLNLILHNSNGDIVKKPKEIYEKFILYYTNPVTTDILNAVKKLQN